MDQGHAKIRMDEVRKHVGDTYFAWTAHRARQRLHYRIHSPDPSVRSLTAGRAEGPRVPNKHVHTVVRTPNGND
jgi:hypothetical protein